MCGVSTVTRCWKIEFWNISSTNKIVRCTFKIIKNSLVAVLFVLTAEWLCNFNTPRSSAFYCDSSIFHNKYFSRFMITPAPLYLLLNLNTHIMCLRTEIIEPARYRVFYFIANVKRPKQIMDVARSGSSGTRNDSRMDIRTDRPGRESKKITWKWNIKRVSGTSRFIEFVNFVRRKWNWKTKKPRTTRQ